MFVFFIFNHLVPDPGDIILINKFNISFTVSFNVNIMGVFHYIFIPKFKLYYYSDFYFLKAGNKYDIHSVHGASLMRATSTRFLLRLKYWARMRGALSLTMAARDRHSCTVGIAHIRRIELGGQTLFNSLPR